MEVTVNVNDEETLFQIRRGCCLLCFELSFFARKIINIRLVIFYIAAYIIKKLTDKRIAECTL